MEKIAQHVKMHRSTSKKALYFQKESSSAAPICKRAPYMVIWSHESKFNLYSDDGKGYVRRPINQRYNKRYTTATVKFGGGNIMVWGCFSWHGLGPLHRITDKMDQFQYKEILETVMLPHAQENLPENWQFQQDNDPKHTAKSVKNWINSSDIQVLLWPAQSPDLNPIENLWGEIERALKGKEYKTKNGLFEAVQELWSNLPRAKIENLVKSMPRRCQAVLNARGYATKY
jgi:hypothetical protein